MSITGIGGSAAGQAAASPSSSSSQASTNAAAVQNFLDYMKETPAQKMEDAWLNAHHLTRQELAQMSPEKREAIMKEMAQDIKNSVTEQAKSMNKNLFLG